MRKDETQKRIVSGLFSTIRHEPGDYVSHLNTVIVNR